MASTTKSFLQSIRRYIKKPREITGPCASPKYRLAVLKATEYLVFFPAIVLAKAIVPTSDPEPETVYDIKYFSRGQRLNHLPIKRTILKESDVEKMMKEQTFDVNDFPRPYLTAKIVEDDNTIGGCIRNNDNEFNPTSLGIYRLIHGKNSSEAKITSVANNPNSDVVESLKILKEAERICKLLSHHHCPASIDAAMNSWAIEINPILVQEVLKKLSNSGFLALSFFRWAEKQKGYESSLESYNALIEALGKIKQFKMLWTLVDEMKHQGILSKDTFALISRRYARARKVKEAIYAFKRMNEFGLIPELNDYNRLIDTLSKSRNVKTAQEVFDKWKNREFKPDIKSYTILLEGWGQEQNLLRLNEVYREMRDDGFNPDVVSYGIMINAYCKAKKYQEALEMYQELERKNIKATPHIYCTLINSLGSEKRLSEALQFFELAKASGQALESPTYNAVVGTYCWSKRMHDAYRIIEEMRRYNIGPNSRTYDIILHHLIKARRTQEAYSVFQKMYEEPGCEPTVSTYEIVVRMFCNEGRTDLALKVWEQMKSKGMIPGMHMFSTLINSLCFENKLDDACEFFEMMLDLGIRPSTSMFSKLKQALLEEGKEDIVVALNNRLEKLRRTQIIG